jgi:hypothetical protein
VRALIIRSFANFTYEDGVPERKSDKTSNCHKIASKGRCVTVTPRGNEIFDFRLAIADLQFSI